VEGDGQILPGLEAILVSGHTPGQQLVLVGEEGEARLLFCGDLIPFASHLRVPWVMAFDLNPLLTLREKHDVLPRAAAEGWVLVFEHDAEIAAATVRREGEHVVIDEQVDL
jgi:glyoxylase-like metal-dependent hydrolase (beta-lactamase superfamily II)